MFVPLDTFPHSPVLLRETLDGLNLRTGCRYIDGTVGAGGHSYAILQKTSPDGKLLGLDVDPKALEIAQARLKPFGERIQLVLSNFSSLAEIALQADFLPVAGVLLDLGVSSMQLDEPERGFSFRQDGPLDMRLGEVQGELTAAIIVNEWPEETLAKVFFELGEEPQSRKFARAIVGAREKNRINSTAQLAGILEKASGGKAYGRQKKPIHSATRVFQALRMTVNRELDKLAEGLEGALEVLEPGGRMAIISFHSLEDRLVKNFIRNAASDRLLLPDTPVYLAQPKTPTLRPVTKKPIIASLQEQAENRRSRSAKLRVAEKL